MNFATMKRKVKGFSTKTTLIASGLLLLGSLAQAHPTGNMITMGEHVLWSYIHPINDVNHYACVMIWEKGAEPKVFIQSEHPASGFMLFGKEEEIYIIERKFLQASDEFQVRILKSTIDTEPTVIWDWLRDDFRIGEGGFFMLSDNELVFGKYPEIVILGKGEKPARYFDFNDSIRRIRAVENNHILLLGDKACYLVKQDGSILTEWNELIDPNVMDAPLNRNQLFDVDYYNGNLLLAYWGKRSFDLIQPNGKRQTILQQSEPLVPHWVAIWKKDLLLFSSRFIFDGSSPKPHLTLWTGQNDQHLIWNR
ncbi:hypothetical protein [Cyclobacterium plantarum]|uniref:hypothetical protein n=1 Tax=Cyclobacterium plantarum TaxID=2716263 RepID=UPI003F72FCB7